MCFVVKPEPQEHHHNTPLFLRSVLHPGYGRYHVGSCSMPDPSEPDLGWWFRTGIFSLHGCSLKLKMLP